MALTLNWPTSTDTFVDPTSSSYCNDTNLNLDEIVARIHLFMTRVEARFGTGSSTPIADRVYGGTATGVASYRQVTSADIAQQTIVGGSSGTASDIAFGTITGHQAGANSNLAAGTVVGGALGGTSDILAGSISATELGVGSSTLLKIAEAAGTGSSGVLTFSSIPGAYRALRILLNGRMSGAVTAGTANMQLNGDTTAGNYDYQEIGGQGGTAFGSENIGASAFILCGYFPGSSSTANLRSACWIDLPEYTDTGAWKAFMCQGAGMGNLASSGNIATITGGAWESTAAITSVTLTASSGNWTTTTRATLYGIPA